MMRGETPLTGTDIQAALRGDGGLHMASREEGDAIINRHIDSLIEQENAQLRARCQVAEGALRLVVRELDYVISTPLTAGDLASARKVLAKARLVLEHGATGGTP